MPQTALPGSPRGLLPGILTLFPGIQRTLPPVLLTLATSSKFQRILSVTSTNLSYPQISYNAFKNSSVSMQLLQGLQEFFFVTSSSTSKFSKITSRTSSSCCLQELFMNLQQHLPVFHNPEQVFQDVSPLHLPQKPIDGAGWQDRRQRG